MKKKWMMNTSILLAVSSVGITGVCAAATKPADAKATQISKVKAALSTAQQKVVDVAKKQVGVKYAANGNTPETGFDCSGLVQYVYKTALNMNVGRSVSEQATKGTAVTMKDIQPGDMVFFNNNTYNGIYVGDNQVIATSGTSKVKTMDLKNLGTPSSIRRVIKGDTSTSEATELKDTYVSVINNSDYTYKDLTLKTKKANLADYYHTTLKAKRYYTIDGVKYYSVYNNKDKWLGYLSEKNMEVAPDQGGIYYSVKRNAKVVKKDYDLWKDLTFKKKRGNTDNLYQQVLFVKGEYHHFNGATYASLYNKENKWLGYVNDHAISYTKGTLDKYKNYKKYVSITKKGFNVYRDKELTKVKTISDKLYQKTYFAKGYYTSTNNDRFLSLYDNDNQWVGYIDEKATTLGHNGGKTMEGAPIAVAATGTINGRDYVLWKDFTFNDIQSTTKKWANKEVYLKDKFQCADGSVYYAVYSQKDGDFLGYLTDKAITLKK